MSHLHTASKYTFAFHPIVWPNYSLHKIEWDTPFIKIFSQIHWFFQIQCFLPVRTAIQQVFNPNNLEFSILIFSDFSLFAIGHFVRSLRPSQWPQWAHQGIKWKLNITAFIWYATCWCKIKIVAAMEQSSEEYYDFSNIYR